MWSTEFFLAGNGDGLHQVKMSWIAGARSGRGRDCITTCINARRCVTNTIPYRYMSLNGTCVCLFFQHQVWISRGGQSDSFSVVVSCCSCFLFLNVKEKEIVSVSQRTAERTAGPSARRLFHTFISIPLMMIQSHQVLLRRTFSCCLLLVCAIVLYLLHWSGDSAGWRGRMLTSVKPFSTHRLYPSNWTLIDRKHFEFLLNSDVCADDDDAGSSVVELLILVTSHPGHVQLRRAFRRSLPASVLRKFNIRRLFLLSQINPDQSGYQQVDQTVIEQEHLTYRDIAQGDFKESYKHLSYKHVMGLKHAAHFCPQAELVLKMDDDTAVDFFQLLHLVREKGLSGPRICGAVMTGDELLPQRNRSSKWFVSYEEYALPRYPPFVSGWAYVSTIEAARLLVKHSESSPFFWIDDVYVTGILSNLSGLNRPLEIRPQLTIYSDHLSCCIQHKNQICDYLILPSADPAALEIFYRQVLECARSGNCSKGAAPSSRCVITRSPSSSGLVEMNGRVIHGQVIPLYWFSIQPAARQYKNWRVR